MHPDAQRSTGVAAWMRSQSILTVWRYTRMPAGMPARGPLRSARCGSPLGARTRTAAA